MKALIFDTETTGLVRNRSLPLDKQPEIIEYCGMLVNLESGKTIRRFESLIKPSKYPMSEQIIKETKTKLSNELLEKAPTFEKVAKRIKQDLESAPVVIAHNAAFDKEMVNIEFERIGQELNWPATICTVEQTYHIRGYRLNLTNLYNELFRKRFDGAHRAAADVTALVECCVELYKKKML